MAPEPNKDAREGGYSPHTKNVGWAILAMGVSLVLVIVAWMWIGYIGPSYSAGVMEEQQATLREEYGLSAQQTSTAELETPPTLRDLSSAGNASNVTSAASDGTGGNQTAAAPASGRTKVSITQDAASKTTDAYDPNPVQVKAGDKVMWTNNDSTPHTATSGKDSKPDGTFDSSMLAQGKSFSFAFEKAGEYPYFCMLHPNMAGTVSVN